MAGSVNKVELNDLYICQRKSIPQISEILGIPKSRTRKYLIQAGIPLRSRADGVRAARDRLGLHMIGTKRKFSSAHCEAIRASAQRRGDISAKGVTVKPDRYMEYTRGPNKGRSVHVVLMEGRIGRRLLPDECVHHIDGDKLNNDINNLALLTRSGHARLHRREDKLKKLGAECLDQ